MDVEEINLFMEATANKLPSSPTKQQLLASLEKRVPFIEEELQEFRDALAAGDTVEVLDAVLDSLYFWYQQLIDLEDAGCNVREAEWRLHENNHSKWTTNATTILDWLDNAPDEYKVCVGDSDQIGTPFCLKDGEGKVRKPYNFKPLDISDCVPDNLK